jgi:hypothetical protein
MSGLNARLFPAPLSFPDALHRAPAGLRAEALQGTSLCTHKSFVASGPIAAILEKNVL